MSGENKDPNYAHIFFLEVKKEKTWEDVEEEGV
jgi:hypothetical protein